MSQIDNSNNNNISLMDSNECNEPENLSGGNFPNNKRYARHKIILIPSSPEDGPSLPKYIKLSNSQENHHEQCEETVPENNGLPIKEGQSPQAIPESSPINFGSDGENQENILSQKKTNKYMKVVKYDKEVMNNDNENPYVLVAQEVTISTREYDEKPDSDELDGEQDVDSSPKETENEESIQEFCNSSSNSEELPLMNDENNHLGAIMKNPYRSQIPTSNGTSKTIYLTNSNNTVRAGSENNSGVVPHDHIYQMEPGNTSTSDHMYQIATITDCAEQNDVGNKSYSFSDLNLAQLILSLKQDVQELAAKVEKQDNILSTVVSMNQFNLRPLFAQNFYEKYDLQVPFTKLQDFVQFNNDLSKNIEVCNEFIASLCAYIDNNVSLSKNILNMIRVYMSRDLASLFTAVKPSGNKLVLKDTLFCKCLLQAAKLSIRHGLLPLEFEKAFLKHLGLAIGGAKSWPIHDESSSSRENSQQ